MWLSRRTVNGREGRRLATTLPDRVVVRVEEDDKEMKKVNVTERKVVARSLGSIFRKVIQVVLGPPNGGDIL